MSDRIVAAAAIQTTPLCKHRTLSFASGGYYILCSSCGMSWAASGNEARLRAGDHGLGSKDIRVETEKG